MKKSFLTVMVVVFILSIVVVGVFGLQFDSYEDRIYSERIECVEYYYSNDGGESIGDLHTFEERKSDGLRYASLDYVEGMTVTLVPQLYPLYASILSSKDVDYPYRFSCGSSCATVDERGVVTFSKKGTATILITPADGSNISASVMIRAK